MEKQWIDLKTGDIEDSILIWPPGVLPENDDGD